MISYKNVHVSQAKNPTFPQLNCVVVATIMCKLQIGARAWITFAFLFCLISRDEFVLGRRLVKLSLIFNKEND